jgi:hypothetical protein
MGALHPLSRLPNSADIVKILCDHDSNIFVLNQNMIATYSTAHYTRQM